MPRSRLRLDLLERRDTPAAGVLDPSFDGDGIVYLDLGENQSTSGSAQAVLVDSDGRILLGGSYQKTVGSELAVVRLNPHGSPDPTFGLDGTVRMNLGVFSSEVRAIARQLDGKIVLAVEGSVGLAGATEGPASFAAVRLNPDGSPDPTFDDNGIQGVLLLSGGSTAGTVDAVAVQPDGKTVFAGHIYDIQAPKVFAARLNPDGSYDDSFGDNGVRILDLAARVTPGAGENLFDVAVQPDGRIVLTGNVWETLFSTESVAAVRLTSDGGYDPTFGGGGVVRLPVAYSSGWRTNAVALQADGKVVLAGQSYDDAVAVRLGADGCPDAGFGDGGFARVPFDVFGAGNTITAVHLSPDGRVVLTGAVSQPIPDQPSRLDFAAIRLTADGAPDDSFGIGGRVALAPGPNEDRSYGSAMQTDGKIVLAGFSSGVNFWSYMTAMRITGDRPPADLRLSPSTVPENRPPGTWVGSLAAFDFDFGSGFTYSLVSGPGDADNSAFEVAANVLRTARAFDFEGQRLYSVRLRVEDGTGLGLEKPFTIRVTNVNEAPTNITLSNATVGELAPAGTPVGTLSAADPDVGDSVTLTLLDSAGGRFGIVGGDRLTVARSDRLDFETNPTHTVRVRAKDAGGLTFDRTVTINVLDQFEGRVAAFGVNGGKAQRSRVTTLAVTFGLPMTVDPAAFTLIRDDGGPLATVGFTTALVGGKTVAMLNFSGAGTEGGSLVDGRYRLTIDPMKVRETATGQPLDGDADGNPGGAYTSSDFHRLFGDVTGDGMVGTADDRIYRAYRARGNARAAAYLRLFDLDASGLVDGADDRQFQARRGRRV